MVPIAALLPADTPRLSGVDEQHVRVLADTEGTLPPILVHRPTMRVIDGMHRLHAALLKHQDEIEARFFHGTDEQAFLLAVEENATHGLPLSAAERRAAACRIIAAEPELSDRAVSAATGLSARSIATLRRRSTADIPQLNTRIGADGRRRPLNGSAGRLRAARIIVGHPSASLREIARAADVSIGTAHDVRTRVRRGENPLPPGQPAPAPTRVSPPPARPIPPPSRTETRDSRTILQSLMNDPSLRYTNNGRDLLRWLRTHTITADTWPDLVEAVPPHCSEIVAELAHQCATTWGQFAQALRSPVPKPSAPADPLQPDLPARREPTSAAEPASLPQRCADRASAATDRRGAH
jgi:ParB-like chromosome segregation protein Spo0J